MRKTPVAGMHVLNTDQLANYSNKNAESALHGLMGYQHENLAEHAFLGGSGSRTYEFHSAVSAQHSQRSDKTYRDSQKYVSMRKEKLSSKVGTNFSGEN